MGAPRDPLGRSPADARPQQPAARRDRLGCPRRGPSLAGRSHADRACPIARADGGRAVTRWPRRRLAFALALALALSAGLFAATTGLGGLFGRSRVAVFDVARG